MSEEAWLAAVADAANLPMRHPGVGLRLAGHYDRTDPDEQKRILEDSGFYDRPLLRPGMPGLRAEPEEAPRVYDAEDAPRVAYRMEPGTFTAKPGPVLFRATIEGEDELIPAGSVDGRGDEDILARRRAGGPL